MKTFLKLNKNIQALFITSFSSLIIFSYNDSIYVKNVESFFIDSIGFITRPQVFYKNFISTKKENENLKNKIVLLNLQNSRLNNLIFKNEQLNKGLNTAKSIYEKLVIKDFQDPYPLESMTFIPGYIVNNNFVSSTITALVSVGEKDSIYSNQPVIDFDGNLVGKIQAVGRNNSKIHLLSDKNFSVSVKTNKSNSISQFVPTYGKYGRLDGVLKSANISVGDIIYTSGNSSIYPYNIPVCKVISTKINKNKFFQDVIVEIISDLDNLSYVYIIQ